MIVAQAPLSECLRRPISQHALNESPEFTPSSITTRSMPNSPALMRLPHGEK